MTLRIMLVGLVASLGFELPSGSDVSCWAQTSTAWFHAHLLDPSGPVVERKLDVAGPSDCQQVDELFEVPAVICEKPADPDAAFQAVTEAIAMDLSADLLASHREETPSDQDVPKLAIEKPAPVGPPENEAAGCLIVQADESKTAEVAWTEEVTTAEPAEPTVESTAKVDRISSAMRLTREAIQAWAAVVQESADECPCTH